MTQDKSWFPPLAVIVIGALLGAAAAEFAWVSTGRFRWYSWVVAPLLFGSCGLVIFAMVRRDTWFERTIVYRHWTEMLGIRAGRIAVYFLLAGFIVLGAGAGSIPLFLPRSVGDWKVPFSGDPKEYEPVLEYLRDSDPEQRMMALLDLDTHPAPDVDLGLTRRYLCRELMLLTIDEALTLEERNLALKLVGKYANDSYIVPLQRLSAAIFHNDPQGLTGLKFTCDRAIEEIEENHRSATSETTSTR